MTNRELTILNLLTMRLQRLQQVAWRNFQSPIGKELIIKDLAHSCVLIHRLAQAHTDFEGTALIGWMPHSQADTTKVFGPRNSFERDITAFILTAVLPDLQNGLIYDRPSVLSILVGMHNTALQYVRELGFLPIDIITTTIVRDAIEQISVIEGIS